MFAVMELLQLPGNLALYLGLYIKKKKKIGCIELSYNHESQAIGFGATFLCKSPCREKEATPCAFSNLAITVYREILCCLIFIHTCGNFSDPNLFHFSSNLLLKE